MSERSRKGPDDVLSVQEQPSGRAREDPAGGDDASPCRLAPLLAGDLALDGTPCRRPDLSESWLRVASGLYVPRGAWMRAGTQERHQVLIEAVRRKYGEDLVLAGASAAVAHGLPLVGTVPRRVDVVAGTGRRLTTLLRRHAGRPEVTVVETTSGPVTGVADTLVDLARWEGLMTGVCAMDAALFRGMCTQADLDEVLRRLPSGSRGVLQARAAVRLADGRSESPGESMSRVRMWENGLPQPELQTAVRVGGRMIRLDFFWPDLRAGGEFDGRVKYQAESFGRDPQEVVWEEKLREDDARAAGVPMARWAWRHAWCDLGAMMLRRLAGIGVRPTGSRW